jgi:hypothetical protein
MLFRYDTDARYAALLKRETEIHCFGLLQCKCPIVIPAGLDGERFVLVYPSDLVERVVPGGKGEEGDSCKDQREDGDGSRPPCDGAPRPAMVYVDS